MTEQARDKIEIEIDENLRFTPLITPGTNEDKERQEQKTDEDGYVDGALSDDAEGDTQSLVDLFSMVSVLSCEYMATRKGEHWRLSEMEQEQLNKSFDKWASIAFADSGLTPGWALIACGGALAIPRVLTDAMQTDQEQATETTDLDQHVNR